MVRRGGANLPPPVASAALTVPTGLEGQTVALPSPALDRLAFPELGHQDLDLVADQLLAFEQGIAHPLDHVALLEEEIADVVAAVVQDRVHLPATIAVRQDGPDRVDLSVGPGGCRRRGWLRPIPYTPT